MGVGDNYHFQNQSLETPDAEKFNGNFSRLNLVPWSLIHNGSFEKYTDLINPDGWTLSGNGAVSKSEDAVHGKYALNVAFGTQSTYISQPAMEQRFLKGHILKAWCFVKCNVPDCARIKISDGTGSTVSSYHCGNGDWEKLTVLHPASRNAGDIKLSLHVDSPGSAVFDCAVLVDYEDVTGYIPSARDAANEYKPEGTADLFGDNVFHGKNTFENEVKVTGAANFAVWKRYRLTAADFAAPTATNTITLCSLPAGSVLHGVKIKSAEAFAGPGLSGYSVTVGTGDFLCKYSTAWELTPPVAHDNFLLAKNYEAVSDTRELEIKITANANIALELVSSGSVDVWLQVSNSF